MRLPIIKIKAYDMDTCIVKGFLLNYYLKIKMKQSMPSKIYKIPAAGCWKW